MNKIFNKDFILQILHYANILGFMWIILAWLFHSVNSRLLTYGGLYLFFVTWIIEFVVEKRWQCFQLDKRTKYFFVPIIFFALSLLYAPFDTGTHFVRLLEYRYPLVGFSLVGLFGMNNCYSLRLVFNYIIVLSLFSICYVFVKAGGFGIFESFAIAQDMYSKVRMEFVNQHMQFDFFLIVALIGIWYLLFRQEGKVIWYKKVLYALSAIIITSTLFFTEGRSGFIAGFGTIGLLSVIEIWRYRRWLGILTSFIMFFVLVAVISQHSRIKGGQMQQEVRLQFWDGTLDLIKHHPILGYGMSRAQDVYYTEVVQKRLSEDYKQHWKTQLWRIDTHNQYLQTILEFGIVGLVLLLMIYILPMFIEESHRLLNIILCGVSMFQSIFDMFVTGTFAQFFCVLLMIMLVVEQQSLSSRLSTHE